MDTVDPVAVRRWKRKWYLAFLSMVLVIAGLVVLLKLHTSQPDDPRMSPFCADIARDFHAHVADLAPKEKLIEYFSSKGWRYSEPLMGRQYAVSIQAPQKDHRVDIEVRVVAGFVYDVKIRDFYISS